MERDAQGGRRHQHIGRQRGGELGHRLEEIHPDNMEERVTYWVDGVRLLAPSPGAACPGGEGRRGKIVAFMAISGHLWPVDGCVGGTGQTSCPERGWDAWQGARNPVAERGGSG